MSGVLTVAWVQGEPGYYRADMPDRTLLLVNPTHRGPGYWWAVEGADPADDRRGYALKLEEAFDLAQAAYLEGK